MVDATWTEQDRSTASIDLPVGRRLFFVSSGVLAKGLIRFVPASPRLRSSAQEARVDLSASFSSAEARRAVDWCMLKRRDGEYGVGIYVSGCSCEPWVKYYRISSCICSSVLAKDARELAIRAGEERHPFSRYGHVT